MIVKDMSQFNIFALQMAWLERYESNPNALSVFSHSQICLNWSLLSPLLFRLALLCQHFPGLSRSRAVGS